MFVALLIISTENYTHFQYFYFVKYSVSSELLQSCLQPYNLKTFSTVC